MDFSLVRLISKPRPPVASSITPSSGGTRGEGEGVVVAVGVVVVLRVEADFWLLLELLRGTGAEGGVVDLVPFKCVVV